MSNENMNQGLAVSNDRALPAKWPCPAARLDIRKHKPLKDRGQNQFICKILLRGQKGGRVRSIRRCCIFSDGQWEQHTTIYRKGKEFVFPRAGKLVDINSKKIVREMTGGKGNVLAFSPAKPSLQEMWARTQDWNVKQIWSRKNTQEGNRRKFQRKEYEMKGLQSKKKNKLMYCTRSSMAN